MTLAHLSDRSRPRDDDMARQLIELGETVCADPERFLRQVMAYAGERYGRRFGDANAGQVHARLSRIREEASKNMLRKGGSRR